MGLRAAAHHYFGREPEHLTLAQSAMLAGLVQAPSRLAPTNNLAAAQKRSRLVLAGDGRHRRDQRGARAASGQPRPAGRAGGQGPDRHLFRRLGRAVGAAGVRSRLRRGRRCGPRSTPTCSASPCARSPARRSASAQAALVAMRPDGRVVAMVGGKQLRGTPVQPRDPGAAPAGLGVQAVRLSRRAARRLDARQHDRGHADHHRRLDPGQQRRRLSRPDHAARSLRPVEQRGDRAAVAERSAAPM